MAEKAAVIGSPVAQSLSPRLFALLARRLRRGVAYRAVSVAPAALGASLSRLKAEGLAGVNVTIPHKRAVLAHLRGLSSAARAIGAVNVVRFGARGDQGHNTDAAGFSDALAAAGFSVRGKRALVFGAGGAARAAGYALGRGGAARVRFSARRAARARALARELAPLFPRTGFSSGAPAPAELWVNATPLGMKGFPSRSPAPAGLRGCELAFDMVYGRDTPFLRQARALGAGAVDGLGMLVFQALRSWEFWFGALGAARRGRLARELRGTLAAKAKRG